MSDILPATAGIDFGNSDTTGSMQTDWNDIVIETLARATEPYVQELIRRNLQGFDEAGAVLASSFRRLSDLGRVYSAEGARYFVLKESRSGRLIGGAGLGSLHGLAPTEGLGEIRDLVLDVDFRGHGLGARLLKRCVEEARRLGYKSLYLETTPQMEKAQKLFLRYGFRPVTHAQGPARTAVAKSEAVPCYFILEQVAAV